MRELKIREAKKTLYARGGDILRIDRQIWIYVDRDSDSEPDLVVLKNENEWIEFFAVNSDYRCYNHDRLTLEEAQDMLKVTAQSI